MTDLEIRRGIVRTVEIVGGSPVCTVEDRDAIDQSYDVPVLTQSPEHITLPPLGSEVLLGKFLEQRFVMGVLTPPREEPAAKADVVSGAEDGHGGVSYTFGPRDGATETEEFIINHTPNGYEITADVDSTITLKTEGDIRLEAGGNIVIEKGGTAKPVLTEDATFEYEDTGDTSDGSGSTATKTTSTVSNGEATETKID